MFKKTLCSLLLTCCAASVHARSLCDSPQYHAFDFWVGEWRVMSKGQFAGNSKITKILNGCVILEEYQAVSGYQGKSLNIFDKQQQQWHQSWTDNAGLLLQLNGNRDNNGMVLQGPGQDSEGKPVLHRITWQPKKNDTVHQHWQSSSNNGKSWQTLFYGIYHKIQ
ncbi:hypothetical protein [Pseudoalteromonas sp. XMcav2-N]|uniref:hypothetical protein n=1 Tax=Pseudoalteromonas sp. XMcav2-N TaxID=2954498 RepID=UPI002096FA38|nr:hypothetical protein [Pseudoalteromonas sp. XMcav2-N]MCO7189762.1 hypothetical protein [Pseudoalteromonas sp. XMcav2-N]